jgi:DNA-binding transcriptional regulator YhcF (GntR family)
MDHSMFGRKNAFTPLYLNLAEKLSEEIISRGLANGNFFCTLKNICDSHDVSITTARKAVDVMVKNNILNCKSSRGIFINNLSSLLTIRSLKNAILIFNDHPGGGKGLYFSLRLGAMIQAFSSNGFTVQVVTSDSIRPEDLELSSGLLKGIVANGEVLEKFDKFVQHIRTVPILISHSTPKYERSDNVYAPNYNNRELVRLSLDYFQRAGKKRIVFVLSDKQIFENFSPLFEEVLDTPLELIFADSSSVKCGRDLVKELIKFPADTGFWVQDDLLGIGVYDGFLRHSIDICAQQRLLVHAGATMNFTEEMGIPVIGYGAWEVGRRMAEFFSRVIRNSETVSEDSLLLSPSGNTKFYQGKDIVSTS